MSVRSAAMPTTTRKGSFGRQPTTAAPQTPPCSGRCRCTTTATRSFRPWWRRPTCCARRWRGPAAAGRWAGAGAGGGQGAGACGLVTRYQWTSRCSARTLGASGGDHKRGWEGAAKLLREVGDAAVEGNVYGGDCGSGVGHACGENRQRRRTGARGEAGQRWRTPRNTALLRPPIRSPSPPLPPA